MESNGLPPSDYKDAVTEFTALSISSSYDDDSTIDGYRTRQKISWRRWWRQRSRFQRTVLYMGILVIAAALIVFLPTSSVGVNKQLRKQQHNGNQERLKSELSEQNDEALQQPSLQLQNPGKEEEEPSDRKSQRTNIVAHGLPDIMVNPRYRNSNVQDTDRSDGIVFKGPQNERQKQVVLAFKHAWKGYKEFAWGHDHLKPLTKTYQDWFGLALTILDSLDTMYIMNLEEEFQEGRTFVAEQLDLNINKDVNLFETTIRILGGLLGAYHMSKDTIFLKKAIELGDLLLPAFHSPSGIPYSDINLYTHHAHPPRWGPDSSVSEVTTLQLEFKDLSRITGDSKYEEAAEKVTEVVHLLDKIDGLVPIYINAETGKFRPLSTITLGARGDSYYEYLLKQWLQTGKTKDFLIRDFNESISGIMKHLVKYSQPSKLLFLGELVNGKNFRPKMDHLVCYLPSVLALGSYNGLPKQHLKLAEQLIYTCYQMYAQMPTFLAPEIAHFNMIQDSPDADIFVKVNDAHNLLRPETVESLWYLYQLTGNRTYQEWGWNIFQAFEKYTKVPGGGYTTIDNVKNIFDSRPRDMMESFFLSETLKYFYLLFSDDQYLIPLDKYVFNSEAHPLPIRDS